MKNVEKYKLNIQVLQIMLKIMEQHLFKDQRKKKQSMKKKLMSKLKIWKIKLRKSFKIMKNWKKKIENQDNNLNN